MTNLGLFGARLILSLSWKVRIADLGLFGARLILSLSWSLRMTEVMCIPQISYAQTTRSYSLKFAVIGLKAFIRVFRVILMAI
jgi:hypothetical protein